MQTFFAGVIYKGKNLDSPPPNIHVMNYISGFANNKPYLHFWNKSYIIVVYYSFSVVWSLFCLYLFQLFFASKYSVVRIGLRVK